MASNTKLTLFISIGYMFCCSVLSVFRDGCENQVLIRKEGKKRGR